jgi:hypothetical protein
MCTDSMEKDYAALRHEIQLRHGAHLDLILVSRERPDHLDLNKYYREECKHIKLKCIC